jgi:hypothetical protein
MDAWEPELFASDVRAVFRRCENPSPSNGAGVIQDSGRDAVAARHELMNPLPPA